LAEAIVGEHETFEAALKRFTKKVQQDGILAEARRRGALREAQRKAQEEGSGQAAQVP